MSMLQYDLIMICW